jgi:ADP-heptose:LPS heptosyltransferase
VLFVAPLAIGDFTYWQNYLQAFAVQYPHIKVDIFVDEVRRTRCFWRWSALRNYSLYDWLSACPWINKVYRETYSPGLLKESIKKARAQRYPLVVSLATIRLHEYAALAFKMSPGGFIAGVSGRTSYFRFWQNLAYKRLAATLNMRELVVQARLTQARLGREDYHITDVYAKLFELFLGVVVEPQARSPFVVIPRQWMSFAKLRFFKWGIDKKTKEFGKVIFINAFAKSHKRSWPLERVLELVTVLKQQDDWRDDVGFVINVMPEDLSAVRTYFNTHSVNDLYLFSADYNFFQLPAIISICDVVISVETAVMHLASALKVPVVALMRNKNPEWRPWDDQRSVVVCASKRNDWVKDVTVAQVLDGMGVLTGRLGQLGRDI